jgi:hypothetical protein
MSDENQAEEQFNQNEENEQPVKPDEKKMLMERLRLMNVKFSNAASVETLRAKLREKLGVPEEEAQQEPEQAPEEPVVEDEQEEAPEEIPEKVEEEVVEETTEELIEDVVEAEEKQAQQAELQTTNPTQDPATYRPQLDHDKDGQNGGSLSVAEREELDTLRAELTRMKEAEQQKPVPPLNPLMGDKVGERPSAHMSKRDLIRKEALALVRVRITNLDPKKKDLPGEFLCVGNKYIGTIRKYIPFNPEQSENGYHIPKVLYDELDGRKFLHIRTFKDRGTGQQRQETKYVKEFSLEVLPPLTPKELAELAAAQRASGSID